MCGVCHPTRHTQSSMYVMTESESERDGEAERAARNESLLDVIHQGCCCHYIAWPNSAHTPSYEQLCMLLSAPVTVFLKY